jgi:hypothetical protein
MVQNEIKKDLEKLGQQETQKIAENVTQDEPKSEVKS